jgi:hypothetical protein
VWTVFRPNTGTAIATTTAAAAVATAPAAVATRRLQSSSSSTTTTTTTAHTISFAHIAKQFSPKDGGTQMKMSFSYCMEYFLLKV